MDKLHPNLENLVQRAGFSNTYERVRLERLIWLTVLDISPLLTEPQWSEIKERLQIPDNFNKRANFNYLMKTRAEQEERYQE